MNHFYHILGIQPGATKPEIKKAFRKKALQLHPDRNPAPDAKQQFQKVLEAYEILYEGKAQYKRVKVQKPKYANPQGKTERDKHERPYTAGERVKAKEEARKRHAEKMAKEFRQQEIRYDNFKKTIRYKFVIAYAAFSFVLGFFLFLDQLIPNKTEKVLIDDIRVEHYNVRGMGTMNKYFALVCHQEIEISSFLYRKFQSNPVVWVEYTPLLEEVRSIGLRKNEIVEPEKINNRVILPYMLLLTIFVFLAEGPSYGYFKTIELTFLVSLLGLVLFVLFSDGFHRLLGFYGC